MDENFDIKRNIMQLYVAAEYLDIQSLLQIIKDYLKSNRVTTNDLSKYVEWATKFGFIKLKQMIIEDSRSKFHMSLLDWRQFVRNMCQSMVVVFETEILTSSG